MNSTERMEIGKKIAERHQRNVMQLVNEFGATTEQALHGCLVALATDIMVALDDPSRIVETT